MSAAEKQRWISAMENVREEVARHDREIGRAKEAAKKPGNLTEIIGGIFGRIADVQKQYEQVDRFFNLVNLIYYVNK